MRKLMLLFTLMLLSASLIFAQEGRTPMHRQGKDGANRLTDEQKTQIQDMRLNLQKELLPLRSDLRSLRSDLKLLMVADRYDAGKTDQIIQKMSGIRAEIQKKRIRQQRAIRDLLTPAQRKKFDSRVLSGHRGGHGKMMGKKGMMRNSRHRMK